MNHSDYLCKEGYWVHKYLIPMDALYIIFEYVPLLYIFECADLQLVSHQFYDILNSNKFWKYFFLKRYKESSSRIYIFKSKNSNTCSTLDEAFGKVSSHQGFQVNMKRNSTYQDHLCENLEKKYPLSNDLPPRKKFWKKLCYQFYNQQKNISAGMCKEQFILKLSNVVYNRFISNFLSFNVLVEDHEDIERDQVFEYIIAGGSDNVIQVWCKPLLSKTLSKIKVEKYQKNNQQSKSSKFHKRRNKHWYGNHRYLPKSYLEDDYIENDNELFPNYLKCEVEKVEEEEWHSIEENSWTCIQELRGQYERFNHFNLFSMKSKPNELFLASCSCDRTVKVWRLCLTNSMKEKEQQFRGLFSWNPLQFQCITTYDKHKDWVRQVEQCSHDDTKCISSCRDGEIHIWDVFTGQTLSILKGHKSVVWKMLVIPSFHYILSVSSDGSLIVWYEKSDKPLMKIERAHSNIISDIRNDNTPCGDSDEVKVITASMDKHIKIWTLRNSNVNTHSNNNDELIKINHDITVHESVVSIDCNFKRGYVVCCTADGWVSNWNIETGKLIVPLINQSENQSGATGITPLTADQYNVLKNYQIQIMPNNDIVACNNDPKAGRINLWKETPLPFVTFKPISNLVLENFHCDLSKIICSSRVIPSEQTLLSQNQGYLYVFQF